MRYRNQIYYFSAASTSDLNPNSEKTTDISPKNKQKQLWFQLQPYIGHSYDLNDIALQRQYFRTRKFENENERRGVRNTYHSTINRGDQTSQHKLELCNYTYLSRYNCCSQSPPSGCYHLRGASVARGAHRFFHKTTHFHPSLTLQTRFKQTTEHPCAFSTGLVDNVRVFARK